MRFRHIWILFVVALVGVGAPGQEKGRPGPRPDAAAVEVRFADGSTVKVALINGSIDVATRYGRLTVPVEEIRRIEFGLRFPPGTDRRIDAAIIRLNSPAAKERDAAVAELLEQRELAYPALQRAVGSADPDVARRAGDALRTLTQEMPTEQLHLPRQDTIVAADFTIVGRVEALSLKARSPYFGEADLKLAELRSVRFLAEESGTRVAVNAARFGGAKEEWKDTGVALRAGSRLQIVATGTVDLRPTPGEAGTTLVGPDGRSPRTTRGADRGFPGGGGPGGGGFPAGAGFPGGRGATRFAAQPSPGVLLGRIGERGPVFVIGSRYEGSAPDEGKLYLRIVPGPYGDSSGSYDVRVITER